MLQTCLAYPVELLWLDIGLPELSCLCIDLRLRAPVTSSEASRGPYFLYKLLPYPYLYPLLPFNRTCIARFFSDFDRRDNVKNNFFLTDGPSVIIYFSCVSIYRCFSTMLLSRRYSNERV